jgi:hypothetical protein
MAGRVDGVCTITKGNLKSHKSTATFAVAQLDSMDGTYNAGASHDPDGTTIRVDAP